jgi:hypothetical protein
MLLHDAPLFIPASRDQRRGAVYGVGHAART